MKTRFSIQDQPVSSIMDKSKLSIVQELSPREMIQSSNKKSPFGIEGYELPDSPQRAAKTTFNKSKALGVIAQASKDGLKSPGVGHYTTPFQKPWDEQMGFKRPNFNKADRVLESEKIAADAKVPGKHVPGPQEYSPQLPKLGSGPKASFW